MATCQQRGPRFLEHSAACLVPGARWGQISPCYAVHGGGSWLHPTDGKTEAWAECGRGSGSRLMGWRPVCVFGTAGPVCSGMPRGRGTGMCVCVLAAGIYPHGLRLRPEPRRRQGPGQAAAAAGGGGFLLLSGFQEVAPAGVSSLPHSAARTPPQLPLTMAPFGLARAGSGGAGWGSGLRDWGRRLALGGPADCASWWGRQRRGWGAPCCVVWAPLPAGQGAPPSGRTESSPHPGQLLQAFCLFSALQVRAGGPLRPVPPHTPPVPCATAGWGSWGWDLL